MCNWLTQLEAASNQMHFVKAEKVTYNKTLLLQARARQICTHDGKYLRSHFLHDV